MGTDGAAVCEFIEYAAPDPSTAAMGAPTVRASMGFRPWPWPSHRHKNVTLYRQGEINFIINAEPDSFAQRFARLHGPSVCAIAFRVQDAKAAYERALEPGRLGLRGPGRAGRAEHPGHQGHRRLADLFHRPLARQERRAAGRHRQHRLLRRRLRAPAGVSAELKPAGHGLTYIDHLTHNVHRGRMGEWAGFYERCSTSARCATSTSRARSPASRARP
jgi:4-hydroxyphenylpyruvate dioxygenase